MTLSLEKMLLISAIGVSALLLFLLYFSMRYRKAWHTELLKRVILEERHASLKQEMEIQHLAWQEKESFLNTTRQQMSDSFKALSSDLLHAQTGQFLDIATGRFERFQEAAKGELHQRQQAIDNLVQPLKSTLEKFERKINEVEQSRVSAHASVREQIQLLAQSQGFLQQETTKLATALRVPHIRGRWGEMQLRRVVELSGMSEHCDFVVQESIGEGKRLRPDLIVNLPNNRQVIIDAKTPLNAYLDSLEQTNEEERLRKLKEHGRQVRSHLIQLSSKSYWEHLQTTSSPEFVVLFLPAEPFFQAAVEQDPSLLEFGIEQKVLIATPMTLVALLKAVAVGWQQESLAQNAEQMFEWGRQLHERLCLFAGYFNDLRKGLDGAVKSYNQAVSSLESRLLVTAKKLRESGLTFKEEVPIVEEITSFPKHADRLNEELLQLRESLSTPSDN